jgi:hypothetical protein
MPCSSEIMDESGNVFKIERAYKLDCVPKEFVYIDKVISWRGQKCCDWSTLLGEVSHLSTKVSITTNDFLRCGFC